MDDSRWEVDLLNWDDIPAGMMWEEPSQLSATLNKMGWVIGDIRSLKLNHNDSVTIANFITELVHEIERLQGELIETQEEFDDWLRWERG